MPSAIRFSHGSAAVREGSRPFSCLKRSARFAKLARFFHGKVDPLGGNHRRYQSQPFFAHGLGQDGIGFAKGIDAVD